ncbi:MAG: 3'-5' exonuclease domain-containing protein 2, partial [Telluria sp.]
MLTDQEELLPPYDGIKLADVRMVKSDRDAADALKALLAMDVLGFDTESKPTFLKGEVSTGPHLIQLASDSTAWLFQIGSQPPSAA